MGYALFRFDLEDDEAVLYLYQLQVSPAHQGHGLGRNLMVLIEDVAVRAGIPKVLLTVQTCNPGALRFYLRLGYCIDWTSPSFNDHVYVEAPGCSQSSVSAVLANIVGTEEREVAAASGDKRPRRGQLWRKATWFGRISLA